jgi:hypothetical protein
MTRARTSAIADGTLRVRPRPVTGPRPSPVVSAPSQPVGGDPMQLLPWGLEELDQVEEEEAPPSSPVEQLHPVEGEHLADVAGEGSTRP